MRLTIVRDGERFPVEVADDRASVTVDGRTYPVRLVAQSALRVELEIAGEKVAVEGWPDRFPAPPAPVDVDGERWAVALELEAGSSRPTGPPAGAAPQTPAASASPPPAAQGIAVLPPMPGKIVELRVRDGERVQRGQVLLVLEAMKMRNEIPSPSDGVVRGLSVAAGGNVRAREPMAYIAPE